MLIKLKPDKWREIPKRATQWDAAKPFVVNKLGVLVHRPIAVTSYRHINSSGGFLAVHSYCGNACVGGDDWYGSGKFTFVNEPEEGAIVCARCEAIAIEAGLPSSAELVGRHVHIGGVKAVKHCCEEQNEPSPVR